MPQGALLENSRAGTPSSHQLLFHHMQDLLEKVRTSLEVSSFQPVYYSTIKKPRKEFIWGCWLQHSFWQTRFCFPMGPRAAGKGRLLPGDSSVLQRRGAGQELRGQGSVGAGHTVASQCGAWARAPRFAQENVLCIMKRLHWVFSVLVKVGLCFNLSLFSTTGLFVHHENK